MKKILWCCVVLFFARVVGQVEVWLVAPNWLPEASAWYSGLLPYPILLPTQIAILMLMSVVAMRARVASPRLGLVLRSLALVYFITMAVRLVLTVWAHGTLFYMHGAIPVAFHWILALFLLVLGRATVMVGSPPASRQVRGRQSQALDFSVTY